MKKNLINYMVIILLSLLANSCDLFGDGKSSQLNLKDVESIEQLQDTIKRILVAQDTLYAGLVNKIDSMSVALKTTDSNFKTLEQQVEALQEPTKLWNYITLFTAVIIVFILVAIFILYKHSMDKEQVEHCISKNAVSEQKVKIIIEKMIDASLSSFKKKQERPSSLSYKSSMPTAESQQIISLERRIVALERLLSSSNRHSTISNPDQRPTPTSITRIGYANINSKHYFLDVFDTKQEASVYEIHFRSDTEGVFDIISLDKIKSRNNWQEVVDAYGDCLMPEANSYEREEYGVCKKLNDNTWEVIKKLKIKLRR